VPIISRPLPLILAFPELDEAQYAQLKERAAMDEQTNWSIIDDVGGVNRTTAYFYDVTSALPAVLAAIQNSQRQTS